ncbi:MAG TPA: proline dehydrogenase family protein [Chloroflexota bacterium]|nr:proline dehydrogenase family protein [Chloroflexota bacterium]
MLRSALLYLSSSEAIKEFTARSGIARRLAHRFVAGETLEEAISVALELNRRGMSTEIDYLGENTTSLEQADAAAAAYLSLLEAASSARADAQASLKLTQMGLDLSYDHCVANVSRVVRFAGERGNFVWVDMESSEYVDRTLELYRHLLSECGNVGVAIQSYLFRSKRDVQELLARGATIRLVKGAYMEPSQVAFPDKSDVDKSFSILAEMLLDSGRLQAIATHDEKLIEHVARFAEEHHIGRDGFEFQMLYGIRRDLQEELVSEGYRLRVYVPYGDQWYPYLMRRMAERPANLFFVAGNVVKETISGRKAA